MLAVIRLCRAPPPCPEPMPIARDDLAIEERRQAVELRRQSRDCEEAAECSPLDVDMIDCDFDSERAPAGALHAFPARAGVEGAAPGADWRQSSHLGLL